MFAISRKLIQAVSDENGPLIKVARHGAVALLTVNRPKVLNALNAEASEQLSLELAKCEADRSVRCLVLTGEGRSFIAGVDIKMMHSRTFEQWNRMDVFAPLEARLGGMRKPVIAAVNGYALGGGFEVAMMCDIIIASQKAAFGQPEIKLGIIPGIGGTQRLARAIGKHRAMEWILTGLTYTAEEAEQAGLISRIVPPEELIPAALRMAENIASYSEVALSLAKDCVQKSMELPLQQGLAYERRTFHSTFATEDQKEGMAAFLEKRPPNFSNR